VRHHPSIHHCKGNMTACFATFRQAGRARQTHHSGTLCIAARRRQPPAVSRIRDARTAACCAARARRRRIGQLAGHGEGAVQRRLQRGRGCGRARAARAVRSAGRLRGVALEAQQAKRETPLGRGEEGRSGVS
jgi:hypothetical protein